MNLQEENILNILAGTNPSELSTDQRHKVSDWRNEAPENESLFDALSFIEQNKESFASYQSIKKPRKGPSTYLSLFGLLSVLAVSIYFAIQLGLFSSTVDHGVVQVAFLDDNTEIHLFGGASYTLDKDFNRSNRKIYLKGDAFFDVSHNEKLPFIIEQGKNKIEVLGTSFNVQKQNNSLHLSVYDGKVRLSNQRGDEMFLVEGESGISDDMGVSFSSNFERNPALVTKVYQDMKIDEILLDLRLNFGFDISFSNQVENSSCRFNGSFENASLTDVLEEFALIFKMKYEIVDQKIFIIKLSC